MDKKLLALACDVIKKSNRQRPADAVLREELKAQRGLSRRQSSDVSRAVFNYYRWCGWLETTESTRIEDIHETLELAKEFAIQPDSFQPGDLMQRAIPAWVRDEMAVEPAWVRAIQAEPKLWLRSRSGTGSALAAKLGDCQVFGEVALADILEYFGEEDLFRSEAFQAGEFELQDIASTAVGLVCDPRPGQTWWDACAGEGGKTLHLSDLMCNQGLVWATDRAAWRLQKLKRRAARAQTFNYRSALWDTSAPPPLKKRFDGILIDAPCSGIGTWQRNPHARWTTTPQDVRELHELQLKILRGVMPGLRPNGKVIYSVCTPSRHETIDVTEGVEREFGEFKPLLLKHPLDANAEPAAQIFLWPQTFGGNTMFIAGWQRGP